VGYTPPVCLRACEPENAGTVSMCRRSRFSFSSTSREDEPEASAA